MMMSDFYGYDHIHDYDDYDDHVDYDHHNGGPAQGLEYFMIGLLMMMIGDYNYDSI